MPINIEKSAIAKLESIRKAKIILRFYIKTLFLTLIPPKCIFEVYKGILFYYAIVFLYMLYGKFS